MTRFSAADSQEFLELIRLLEAQTPIDTPARDELIRNTARAWLVERSRVKRITKGR